MKLAKEVGGSYIPTRFYPILEGFRDPVGERTWRDSASRVAAKEFPPVSNSASCVSMRTTSRIQASR